jgi:hypothetical protein
MALLPQEPQPIGKILDAGIALYRDGFRHVIGLSAASALAITLTTPEFWEALGYSISGLLYAVGLAVYWLCYLGVMRGLADVGWGQPAKSAGEYVSFGARKFLPALLALILYVLAMFVGLILLVVPGLILMVSLMLAIYSVIIEDMGGYAAIKRSHQLVWGNWWKTAIVITVAFLIYLAAFMALAGLGLALAWGMGLTTIQDPAQLGGVYLVGYLVINGLVSMLLGPLLIAVTLALFNDLRLRKGGSDLAARIGALPPGG